MKIYAGPCLLTDNEKEIDDIYITAEKLAAIDKDIRFRCKLWGGGTRPEKYVRGLEVDGLRHLANIKRATPCLKTGIEIRDYSQLNDMQCSIDHSTSFLWVAARTAQNYELLRCLAWYLENSDCKEILIKRHPGMTVDEIIGIYDICDKIHGYKPMIVERGINTFCRREQQRWMPDFQGMLRIIQERPDIELCFDVSHSCFIKEHILPMTKAAVSLGVKNFMFEVMNDPSLTKSDGTHMLNIEEFINIYNYIKANVC